MYDEQTFFGGFHFAHIVAFLEQKRLARIREQSRRAVENRHAR